MSSREETELPPRQEYPICDLPLTNSQSSYFPCCGRVICYSCVIGRERAELKEIGEIIEGITPEEEQCILISQNGSSLCPFCRSKGAENDEEHLQFLYNRIKARNDRDYTRALIHLGSRYKNGQNGLPQDIVKAEELYQQAYDLDDPHAAARLADLYRDYYPDQKEKKMKYLQRGDMLGNVYCTEILAELANDSVNYDEMARLCMKAARLGNDNCMEYVFGWYREGEEFLSKDDLATTLRAHQAVNDA